MFLSLILLLVLSLLCTVIEGARVNTAKVSAKRALTAAMDSTLAGYYAPLWNEYHIFALNTGSSDFKTNNNLLTQTVKDYMEYSINPDKDQTIPASKKGVDILDIDIDKLILQSSTGLMDYGGELFINQAVEYMKYDETGAGLELLLEKLSLLEQPGKVSYIMEEKQKLEEELVEIDEELLELMELFDGLKTSKKGVELNRDGSLKTTNSFIKKLCYSDITMDGVGINNEIFFQAQRDKYINPSTAYFEHINNSFMRIEDLRENINELHIKITGLEKVIMECDAELGRLNAKEDLTAIDKEITESLIKSITECSKSISNLQKQVKDCNELIKTEKSNISSISALLQQLLDDLAPLHGDAIKSINKIINKAYKAAPLIAGYETLLNRSREELSEEIYEGLEEELAQLKKYSSFDKGGYDFPGMLKVLENNKQVLSDVKLMLTDAGAALDKEDYSAAGLYTAAKDRLTNYQIKGLRLDYSTMVYDKSNQRDVLDKINSLIAGGLSSLVINPDDISDADLSNTDDLPSFIHALTAERSDFSETITAFFKNSETGDKKSEAGALFGEFSKETDIKKELSGGLNKLAELVLFRGYLDKHFSSYQPKSESVHGKPASIKYEQEYLVIGKYSDSDNLYSIITRIILIRMIFDFISVLSDKSIRNEARLIANTLVGFTGLPILVLLTQMLIMLIWSFAEALLDVTALMMGKEVPILKRKVAMTFPEIFMLTREQLSKKAATMQESKELSLNYKGYLKIFLLTTAKEKLTFRSMDLIQENIRLRYNEKDFKISSCLYGFEMSAQFGIKRRFTSFAFLQKYYDRSGNRYQFSALAADSY